jgi:hypothetical protein
VLALGVCTAPAVVATGERLLSSGTLAFSTSGSSVVTLLLLLPLPLLPLLLLLLVLVLLLDDCYTGVFKYKFLAVPTFVFFFFDAFFFACGATCFFGFDTV